MITLGLLLVASLLCAFGAATFALGMEARKDNFYREGLVVLGFGASAASFLSVVFLLALAGGR